ncbi:MAG: hypothetical protein ACMUIL_00010 [bacterium]
MRPPKAAMLKNPSQTPTLGTPRDLEDLDVHKDVKRSSISPHGIFGLREGGEVKALHLPKAHGDVLDGVRSISSAKSTWHSS